MELGGAGMDFFSGLDWTHDWVLPALSIGLQVGLNHTRVGLG